MYAYTMTRRISRRHCKPRDPFPIFWRPRTYGASLALKQVILAPDGDDAGQAVIQEAAKRLAGQGREVRAAKLPVGKDWCDVLDEYEECAGILEFDFEQYRPDAEAQTRREVVHG